jgi:hypothetical protein
MQPTLDEYYGDGEDNYEEESDYEHKPSAELNSLQTEIEHLSTTANLLGHRLDTMQSLLDQHTFQLEFHPIRVAPQAKAEKVRELLVAVDVAEEGLTLGQFLKSLNLYLVRNDLVDLNDLQIILSPLLAAAFQKPRGLKKVPYALLLATLPRIFETA